MKRGLRFAAAAILLAGLASEPARALPPGVSYLHRLSSLAGVVPYSDVRLQVDRAHGEIYAVAGNTVRVFNGAGMEIYKFDAEPAAGQIVDVAALQDGDLVLLVYPQVPTPDEPSWSLVHADYRGVPLGRIAIAGAPPDAVQGFRPDTMFYEGGRLLLLDRAAFRLTAISPAGAFQKSWDVATLAGLSDKERRRAGDIGGAGLDPQGRLLLTIPTLARAYVLPFDGAPRAFGRGGSAPGSFGVPAGIAADDRGNIFVADKSRGVVMIFDAAMNFTAEFGNEDGAAGLIRPTDLAWSDGRLYVTQSRDRGVSIYRVAPPGTGASLTAPGL
jgi:hypothetical protein